MICLVYVDDKVLAGPENQAIEDKIKILGVSYDEHRRKVGLRDEVEVRDFLGIRMEKTVKSRFYLT